jgi:hypothetical protein
MAGDQKFLSGWWFQTFGLFSISYMGFHPNPIDQVIFFRMVKTTNQMRNIMV